MEKMREDGLVGVIRSERLRVEINDVYQVVIIANLGYSFGMEKIVTEI